MSDYPSPNPLGQDPNFLTYLQGFLAKPKDADLLKGKRISSIAPTDGQALTWSQTNNCWQPGASGGVSGTISLAKLTTGGSNGSITVTNGIITSFTNPT